MQNHSEPVRHALALVVFSAFTALSSAAHAVVTYTYTGPAFNSFDNGDPSHPVNAEGLIASLVFDAPLGPDVGSTDNYALVTPSSWTISGGGYGLASVDAGASLSGAGVFVYTDASGALQGWDFLAYVSNGSNDSGPRFRSFFYPTGQFSTSGPAIKTDGAFYWNIPSGISSGQNTSLSGGSWTVSAVPEPGTTAMWLAGVGALGLLARRRGRA